MKLWPFKSNKFKVFTEDNDGEVRRSVAERIDDDTIAVRGLMSWYIAKPDGTFKSKYCYLIRWWPRE